MTATAVEQTARSVGDLSVTTTKETLLDALNFAYSAVPNRTILPVLAGVRIEGHGGTTTVSAFDYEISTRQVIDATGSGGTLVDCRGLRELMKGLTKGAQVTLLSDGSNRLKVIGDGVTYTVPELPIDEYPALPHVSGKVICDLPVDVLARLSDVGVAAGRDDTLPVLTGLHLSPEPHKVGKREQFTLQAAATDRYRLCVFDTGIKVPGDFGGVLIPASSVVLAAKWFTDGPVRLTADLPTAGEGLVSWSDGVRTLTTRLLDGEFPKYRSLLPDAFDVRFTVPAKDLVKGIQQVSIVASRTSPVRITADTDHLVLEAGGLDEREASKPIPNVKVDGPAVTWAANPHYLIDGASVIGGDVLMSVVGPTKPFVLQAPDVDAFRYLLMPVRLAG